MDAALLADLTRFANSDLARAARNGCLIVTGLKCGRGEAEITKGSKRGTYIINGTEMAKKAAVAWLVANYTVTVEG